MKAVSRDQCKRLSSARGLTYAVSEVKLDSPEDSSRLFGAFLADRKLSRLAWLVPFGLAGVYLLVFLSQVQHNIREIAWSSDYSAAFTIAETVARYGSGGHTVLGGSGQWVPLWFGILTAGLPFHHELWGLAPTLLFVASALLVGWSVARFASRRTAVLASMLAFVASPLALSFLMAPLAHNTVFPCTALVGAYLVWLASGVRPRRRAIVLAVSVVMGVVLGICLASDLLLVGTATVPLALTGVIAGLRRDRPSRVLALGALTTVAVGAGVGELTSSIMASSGFHQLATPAELAPASELWPRSQLLFSGLKSLFNGYLSSGRPGTLHSELGVACEILMSAALLSLVVLGALAAVKLVWSGWRNREPRNPARLAESLHVVYWTSSAIAACSAFVLTAQADPSNVHASYYGTVILSVAAVVPLLMRNRALGRWLVPAGASIFFAASLAGMLSHYLDIGPGFALPRYESDITAFARANHVRTGYGGYWEAASTTWNSNEQVIMRPVMICEHPEGADLCPFTIAWVPAWYQPGPGKSHTFLLVDKWEQWVKGLPPGLGRPLAHKSFGTMTMYIYPYDIASRMGPAPD